jgi:hypothetical protein
VPIHDWTRVDAGVFHDFHNVWIGELRNAFNGGLLPEGYYAMSEQHAGRYLTYVIALHAPAGPGELEPKHGAVAVAEKPPKVRTQLTLSTATRKLRKTLTIRHVSNDRIVALLEIVSPGNKDREKHVSEFATKVEDALSHGIHVLVVDLFPPGKHDPHGMHGAIWDRLGDEPVDPPRKEPLTLVSYVADTPVRAWLEHAACGKKLPDMPLFLDIGSYVTAPLEATYESTWRGTPQRWRDVLASPLRTRMNGRGKR